MTHHTRFDAAMAPLNARVRARTGDDMTTTIPAGWKIQRGTDDDGEYIDITPPEGEAYWLRYYDEGIYMSERLTYRLASALLDAQPEATQAEPVAPSLTHAALRWLDEVEACQGGANGPTIKLRASILALGEPVTATVEEPASPQPPAERAHGIGDDHE